MSFLLRFIFMQWYLEHNVQLRYNIKSFLIMNFYLFYNRSEAGQSFRLARGRSGVRIPVTTAAARHVRDDLK